MNKPKLELMIIAILVLILVLLTGHSLEARTLEVERIIRDKSTQYNLNPDLMVAIARTESGLDPNAVGGLGEIGVFQLRPEFHDVRPGDVEHNIETAILYLAEIRRKWEPVYGDAWFIKYNLGPNYRRLNYPKRFPYYVKVMSHMGRTVATN
jgi:soluble lytic murein transglycosylase-like protein